MSLISFAKRIVRQLVIDTDAVQGVPDANSLIPYVHIVPAVPAISRVERVSISADLGANKVVTLGGLVFNTNVSGVTGANIRTYVNAHLASIPAVSVGAFGSGHFDVTLNPGLAGNSLPFTSEDSNMTFSQQVAGANLVPQVSTTKFCLVSDLV